MRAFPWTLSSKSKTVPPDMETSTFPLHLLQSMVQPCVIFVATLVLSMMILSAIVSALEVTGFAFMPIQA